MDAFFPSSLTHPDGLLEDGDLPGEVVVLDLERLDVRLDLRVGLLGLLPRLDHLLLELTHQHGLFLEGRKTQTRVKDACRREKERQRRGRRAISSKGKARGLLLK